MRQAFTLLEAIFVIVILGVLAAVALPRYLTVQDSTNTNLVKSFTGTLNRTTGPTMWSESLAKGHRGSISYGSDPSKFEGRALRYYVDIPVLLDPTSVNFHNCVRPGQQAQPFLRKKGTGIYNIFCLDGNESHSPYFVMDSNNAHQF